MGRNHPIGILIAAFLFGILYQGGAELDFELQNVSRDIVVVMQGLVILFCGGLEYLYRPVLKNQKRGKLDKKSLLRCRNASRTFL